MPSSLIMAIGTGVSMFGAMGQASAQKDMVAAQLAIEKQRKLQMELEARRKRLETVRNIQRAQSNALATATAQGAQQGSGLLGAYGQIYGQGVGQVLGINQNQRIGENIFDINQQMASAQMAYADAGTMMAIGSGISSLGSAFGKAMPGMRELGFGGGGGAAPQAPSATMGSPSWYQGQQTYSMPGVSQGFY